MTKQFYMLDTNTVSYIIKGNPAAVSTHLKKRPISSICISAITEAELLTGVAKKPDAKQLHKAVHEFLIRVDIMLWDTNTAKVYAKFRTACESKGKPLGNMDMLIAAHSIAVGATLITSDKAFFNVKELLDLEDWTKVLGSNF